MEQQTIDLLKVCNSGSKMATNSIEQTLKFVKEEGLVSLLEKHNKEHIAIGEECQKLLEKMGAKEEDPSLMAKSMSFFTTAVKLRMDHEASEVAKLMMDGCNMGIQSIAKAANQYKDASKESLDLAKRLLACEEEFMKELKYYL
ncbi:MAG: hypothetical protein PWP24_981 [Clostridiales bacterium]|nr:hypothetical protein [Clostridiales bacterium]